MTIVNTCSNQSSTRRFDNANTFFRVQRGLNSESRWNKAEIFAAVVESELLFYTSDVSCITDVIVSKKMASPQVVETSVTNKSPSLDSNHPDDLIRSALSSR